MSNISLLVIYFLITFVQPRIFFFTLFFSLQHVYKSIELVTLHQLTQSDSFCSNFVAALPALFYSGQGISNLECWSSLLGQMSQSRVLFVTFNVALSSNFKVAICEISSTYGASVMTNFCPFGLTSTFSFGKKGIDLFRKLKQESCVSITPSNSKIFLIP